MKSVGVELATYPYSQAISIGMLKPHIHGGPYSSVLNSAVRINKKERIRLFVDELSPFNFDVNAKISCA